MRFSSYGLLSFSFVAHSNSVHGHGSRARGRAHLRSERPYNSRVSRSTAFSAFAALSPPYRPLHPLLLPVVPPPLAAEPPPVSVSLESHRLETAIGFQEGGGRGRVEASGPGRGPGDGPGDGRRESLQVEYVVVLWNEEERAFLTVMGPLLRRDEVRGIMIIIHGLNEHSGRYAHFARQLTSCNFGVYAMDWIGHGGSDGLHGYVPSLDHVVADTGTFLEKIRLENPGIPCFLFGHSTGGAVVLKAASHPHIESMLEGIVLTSPALRVKPAHPIVGAVAPIFSLVVPKFQFKGANKRGIPVSRDPAALVAKYSDPLVYTGPIRVRTGHEILRISSHLLQNMKSVTVPFFVLHGTADKVTDPLASQDLYNEAASNFKDIKLYEGFLHDLLFEPEREEIAGDIICWMEKRLQLRSW